jgi:hypothetical protein
MVSSVCDPSPPAADTVTIVQQPIAPPCSIPTFHNDQANFSQWSVEEHLHFKYFSSDSSTAFQSKVWSSHHLLVTGLMTD